ncbi:MAG: hypothetical protein RLZZ175_3272 [Bacteroidota bacterium]|jgi:hypothetical protein
MRIISVFIILISIVSCTHKHEPLRYEKLIVDKQTKHLIDSTLAVIQQLSFTADTTFGQSTGEKHGKIDVQINCLDSVGCFASIFIDNDSTDFAEAFIFKIDKTKWTFVHSMQIGLGNNFDIELKDINFDYKKDLCFSTIFSCSRLLVDYQIFENNNNFNKITQLTSTDSIGVDYKNQTLILFTDGGNFGTHETLTYKWNNGNMKLVYKINKSFAGFDKNDSPIIQIDELKLVGDSMKVVKSYYEK